MNETELIDLINRLNDFLKDKRIKIYSDDFESSIDISVKSRYVNEQTRIVDVTTTEHHPNGLGKCIGTLNIHIIAKKNDIEIPNTMEGLDLNEGDINWAKDKAPDDSDKP